MVWTHRESLGQSTHQGTCDADPSVAPGLVAPAGSVVVFSGVPFAKTGAGDTAWDRMVPQHFSTTGSNDADTTSTSPVLVEGAGSSEPMTLTPGVGTFWAVFTCEGNVTAALETLEVSLYVDTTPCPDSAIQRKISNVGDVGSLTTQAVCTVAAGETVQARSRSIGGQNVRVTARQLVALRLS